MYYELTSTHTPLPCTRCADMIAPGEPVYRFPISLAGQELDRRLCRSCGAEHLLKNEASIAREIGQMASDTIECTLSAGVRLERRTLNRALEEDDHLAHAIAHLEQVRAGATDEDHEAHALARLAMRRYHARKARR